MSEVRARVSDRNFDYVKKNEEQTTNVHHKDGPSHQHFNPKDDLFDMEN